MDKKKIIILGVLAAAGIGLYMWSKKKSTSAAAPTSGAAPVTATGSASIATPSLATTAASYDETLITSWIDKMKASKEWYDAIQKKASEAGRSIEEQLRMDAIFMIEKK